MSKESLSLLAEIDDSLKQFMHMPSEHCFTVCSLWVAHTHLRDHNHRFLPQRTPRLYFGSKEAGAGKTLAMELVTMMSHAGVIHVNPTQFALVTSINIEHGTNGIDEIDRFFGTRGTAKADITTVILAGYKKGAFVTRQRNDDLEKQNVHGPMVLAGKNLNRFLTSDAFETLRTRSIAVPLARKPNGTEVDKYNSELHEPRLRSLSHRLQRWGLRNGQEIVRIDVTDQIDLIGLDNRDEEIWSILFRIAEYVGGNWPQRIESAARALVLGEWEQDSAPVQSPAEELREAALLAFGDDEFLPTRILISRILEDAPSNVWYKREWRNPMAAAKGFARTMGNVFAIEASREYVDGKQERGYSRDSFIIEDEFFDDDSEVIDHSSWDWSLIDE